MISLYRNKKADSQQTVNLLKREEWVSEIVPIGDRKRLRRIPYNLLLLDPRQTNYNWLFDVSLVILSLILKDGTGRPDIEIGTEVEIQWRSHYRAPWRFR